MTANGDLGDLPFELTETDRENLVQGDKAFEPLTWDEVKAIIARNDLSVLKRKPSDLVRYIHWTRQMNSTYGSITNFLLKERLHWEPLGTSTPDTGPIFDTESDIPFGSPKDFLIRYNDWPYGLSPEITHLVVWLKTRIPVEGKEGYLTAESQQLLDSFVTKTFVKRIEDHGGAADQIMWFKNWVSLQSVRGVEHIHVLIRDAPKTLLDEWTSRGP